MKIVPSTLIVVALLAGCATADTPAEPEAIGEADAELRLAAASAPKVPHDLMEALSAHPVPESLLDQMVTLDHFVPVGRGRKIHLRETFTLRSVLRSPRRAILMIPGAPVNGEFFNIPVEGYNGRDIMAKAGFFSFTADQEGSGQSTFPQSGLSPTYEVQTESFRRVVEYIHLVRRVPKVDVLGESTGGGVAAQVCAFGQIVRSCTLASMIYRTGTEFFNNTFGSPAFQAFILSQPNGYLITTPEIYFNITAASPPDVTSWIIANQPGPYALGLVVQDFHLPSYDPTRAAVPGLIIRGQFDQNVPLSDTIELSNDYGSAAGAGPAAVVEIAGGTHAVRVDIPPRGPQYWNVVKNFVDP
jgi:pimeloyl-ACP methyl ester carboxylesterase